MRVAALWFTLMISCFVATAITGWKLFWWSLLQSSKSVIPSLQGDGQWDIIFEEENQEGAKQFSTFARYQCREGHQVVWRSVLGRWEINPFHAMAEFTPKICPQNFLVIKLLHFAQWWGHAYTWPETGRIYCLRWKSFQVQCQNPVWQHCKGWESWLDIWKLRQSTVFFWMYLLVDKDGGNLQTSTGFLRVLVTVTGVPIKLIVDLQRLLNGAFLSGFWGLKGWSVCQVAKVNYMLWSVTSAMVSSWDAVWSLSSTLRWSMCFSQILHLAANWRWGWESEAFVREGALDSGCC